MNPAEMDPHLRIRQMSLDLSSPNHIPLNVRIAEFCEDPQNVDEMNAFIDDILKKAQTEATARLERKNKVGKLSGLAILWVNYANENWKNEEVSVFLMNNHRKAKYTIHSFAWNDNDARVWNFFYRNFNDYIIFFYPPQTESKKNGKGNKYFIIIVIR